MDGQIDKWMDKQIDKWMDRQINGQDMERKMDR